MDFVELLVLKRPICGLKQMHGSQLFNDRKGRAAGVACDTRHGVIRGDRTRANTLKSQSPQYGEAPCLTWAKGVSFALS